MASVALPLFASFMLAGFAHAEQPPAPLVRDLVLEWESGPGYVVQNEHQYGATGTRYDEAEIGQQRNLFIGKRIAAEARFGARHAFILLYAPLDLTTRATLPKDIDFRGTLFREGEVVDHRYLFDGYRGSYLFQVLQSEKLRWEVGASVQVRNASVELRSIDAASPRFAVEHDIGVVFALKTRLHYAARPNLWAAVEADATSTFGLVEGVSGALYDVALSLGTPVRPGVDAFLRLRWLGGGAKVDKRSLDNWANLFFATAGLRADLVDL